MFRLIARAFLLFLLLSPAALAAERITPEGGSATVKGTIKGDTDGEYMIAVKAGETLTVSLNSDNNSTYFNVWAPGKVPGNDEALFAGAVTGDVFSQQLDEAGDYMVQVYLYRNAARRGETSHFTVSVKLGVEAAVTEPQGDFADGLMGGPDFWEVTGLAPGKSVNLRSDGSSSAAVVGRVVEGTILRNKGCKMEGANRWCQVEQRDDTSVKGWIAGKFLREAAVSEGAPSTDALVPGTNYHAVGRIPCTLDGQTEVKDCEFGVTRGQPGIATIFITVPNGFVRVISFDAGKAAPQSGVTSFEQQRQDDNTIVKVNGMDETYVIPDAVINGG